MPSRLIEDEDGTSAWRDRNRDFLEMHGHGVALSRSWVLLVNSAGRSRSACRYQYLRALIEVPNRLENRLFLVNVTLPSCAQRKKESCIPTRPREKSRGYAGGLMR